MRSFLVVLSKGIPVRASLAVGLLGAFLAGCSSSIDRFADYPGETDRTHTASTPKNGGYSSSDEHIESSALKGSPTRSAASNPYQAPVYSRVRDYEQPQNGSRASYQEPETAGGSIIVEPGQTLYSIARANSVSVSELAAANRLRPPYHLRAGQRIRVPGVDEPRAEATYAPVQQNFSQKSALHTVKSGETLFSLGRRYAVHPYKIADFNGLSHDTALSTGQKLRIPGGKFKSVDRVPAEETYAQVEDASSYSDEQDADKTDLDNSSEIAYAPANGGEEMLSDAEEEQSEPLQEEEAGNGFRWPVKGRIISKYGSKPGGTRNEGINIAVPEGTSVRAAESGVIAYAGNELKGYGNLILIRHDGGWVTAYAHNKQLFVRRGDTVRRGDVIAKAGQTGSVDSPQVHFELRRGATAVDPMKYLTSSQAANY
jgi:murein DD-endopeptidase MepM/ murein hydrolase activator NlpD